MPIAVPKFYSLTVLDLVMGEGDGYVPDYVPEINNESSPAPGKNTREELPRHDLIVSVDAEWSSPIINEAPVILSVQFSVGLLETPNATPTRTKNYIYLSLKHVGPNLLSCFSPNKFESFKRDFPDTEIYLRDLSDLTTDPARVPDAKLTQSLFEETIERYYADTLYIK